MADSVSVCFSKGLGAPVGSALVGSTEFIMRARRVRKMFGGAMRQSGLLAAAAIHALDHHVTRLADDHARARRLAQAISAIPGLTVDPPPDRVETNMVFFSLPPTGADAAAFCAALKGRGVNMIPMGPRRVRAVLHLDTPDDVVALTTAALSALLQPAPKS